MKERAGSLLALALIVLCVVSASRWWAARHDSRLGSAVAALAAPGDIRMLSSTTCAYCAKARGWMREHQVAFDECFIETDTVCANQYAALRAAGTPLVLVRGQPQLGFNAQRVHDRLAVPLVGNAAPATPG
ncbi:MAG: glutaredoxin domain-containing protein [Rubrivivax sp.]